MKIEIREIKPGTPEHALEMELRTHVLRIPLGLTYTPSDIAEETNDLHLGAFQGDQLLGCLLLRDVGNSIMKMRQVAVGTQVQGLGVGTQLVLASEALAKQRGVKEIQLHARDTAVPFYTNLGYEVFEAPFTEVGIAHRKMRKSL